MRILISAILLAVILPTSANARDLPLRRYAKPPVVVQNTNWSGWYAGVSIGWSHGSTSTQQRLTQPGCAGGGGGGAGCALQQAGVDSVAPNVTSDNITFGAQGGYNKRFNQFLFGVEADLNYVGLTRTSTVSATWVAGGTKTITTADSVNSNVVFTLRPRVGYIPTEAVLLYLTGGLALSDQKFTNNSNIFNAGPGGISPGFNAIYSSSASNAVGYVVGGGVEYLWSPSMTIKGEYQHLEFSNPASTGANLINVGGSLALSTLTSQSTVKADILRVGANWKL